MEDIYELLSAGFAFGQKTAEEGELRFTSVEKKLEAYLARAKDTLSNRQAANPKPPKRFMKTIQDESESDDDESLQTKAKVSAFKAPAAKTNSKDVQQTVNSSSHVTVLGKTFDECGSASDLRPIRSAKSKATLNLKEVSVSAKMRNDNNEVVIKKERSVSLRSSSESIKENKTPANGESEKRRSPDEGIQSAGESDVASARNSKRSNSVEVISAKLVEIDITSEDDALKMRPPPSAVPLKKAAKKTRAKTKQQTVAELNPPPAEEIRITRSKIKLEKVSMSATPSEISVQKEMIAEPVTAPLPTTSVISSVVSINETIGSKKGKKKYPMPMLIKVEPEELTTTAVAPAKKKSQPKIVEEQERAKSPEKPAQMCNETFNVASTAFNETVTIAPAADPNATVTLTKNVHDSLMTEDNDDEDADVSMEVLPPPLPPKKQQLPVSAFKLKKNEVFNPYLSSPVKQKVQAFEKHAVQATPDKYNTMPPKYGSLKAGTPSKIASYSKTTPLNLKNSQKYTSASTSSLITSTVVGSKTTKPLKKGNSLSQEALDEYKRTIQANQLMEEKRKAREEKQRLAAQLRETMEKEKRDQAMKTQIEREEKHRKIMREKEEKIRMDALKKKLAKEKQAKKFAEEKAKNMFVQPKPFESSPAVNKTDNLHLQMQKQLLLDRSLQKKKEESKNTYSFEMLHTDDSTDDEARPSIKRPPPPEWSKKRARKPQLLMQSNANPSVLDSLFSSTPISVDLRAIFPNIDSKKLVRNSSAIWKTPPKQYY